MKMALLLMHCLFVALRECGGRPRALGNPSLRIAQARLGPQTLPNLFKRSWLFAGLHSLGDRSKGIGQDHGSLVQFRASEARGHRKSLAPTI